MIADRRSVRHELTRVAASQAGYFTAAQALALGYSYQAQRHHVVHGNWIKIDRGIFRLRDWPTGEHDHLVRWALWSDGTAIVSHSTALSVHGLGDVDPATVHLSVPAGFRRVANGAVLHRSSPPQADVEEREGFRVTTPTRALSECAEMRIEQQWLDTAVRDALDRGLTTIRRLRDHAAGVGPAAELGIQRALEALSQ